MADNNRHQESSTSSFGIQEIQNVMCSSSIMEDKWEYLPEHLLVGIFQHLKPVEILRHASLCCSRWYDASENPRCWDVLDFWDYHPSVPDLPDDEIRRGFNKVLWYILVYLAEGSTTKVIFPSRLLQDETHVSFISDWSPKVRYFSMTLGRNMDFKQERRACDAIKNLKDLEGMDVDGCFIGGRVLDTNGNYMTGRVLQFVGAHCPKFTNLRVRSILTSELENAFIPSLTSLRTLSLQFGVFTSWNPLRQIVAECNNLRSLDISNSHGFLRGFKELYEEASQLEEFRWENLSDIS